MKKGEADRASLFFTAENAENAEKTRGRFFDLFHKQKWRSSEFSAASAVKRTDRNLIRRD